MFICLDFSTRSERREVPPPKRESRVRVDRSISLRETKQPVTEVDGTEKSEKKGVQRNQAFNFSVKIAYFLENFVIMTRGRKNGTFDFSQNLIKTSSDFKQVSEEFNGGWRLGGALSIFESLKNTPKNHKKS